MALGTANYELFAVMTVSSAGRFFGTMEPAWLVRGRHLPRPIPLA